MASVTINVKSGGNLTIEIPMLPSLSTDKNASSSFTHWKILVKEVFRVMDTTWCLEEPVLSEHLDREKFEENLKMRLLLLSCVSPRLLRRLSWMGWNKRNKDKCCHSLWTIIQTYFTDPDMEAQFTGTTSDFVSNPTPSKVRFSGNVAAHETPKERSYKIQSAQMKDKEADSFRAECNAAINLTRPAPPSLNTRERNSSQSHSSSRFQNRRRSCDSSIDFSGNRLSSASSFSTQKFPYEQQHVLLNRQSSSSRVGNRNLRRKKSHDYDDSIWTK